MKNTAFIFSIAIIFMIVGFMGMIFDVNDLNLVTTVPDKFPATVKTYEYELDKKLSINYPNINTIITNNIEGAKVIITYYNTYNNVKINETSTNKNIELTISDQVTFQANDIIKEILVNLENRKIYNYPLLYKTKVDLYVSENNLEKIIY